LELLGTKIQTLRKNKNMTQAQLAEVLSVSSQSVSKWETNASFPDISLLPIIARFFGITMDELFNYRLDNLNYKERFIRFMAENGVLRFGEFPLRSGIVSPYSVAMGNYKSGSQIVRLGEFYAECIRENEIHATLLMGSSEQDIPVITATSMILYSKYGIDIKYCVDGTFGKRFDFSDKITLIKDTLTSGDTLKTILQELQESVGKPISNIIVAVNRMNAGQRAAALQKMEREYGVKIFSIVTLDDIIAALETGVIAGIEYLDSLRRYRENYIEF